MSFGRRGTPRAFGRGHGAWLLALVLAAGCSSEGSGSGTSGGTQTDTDVDSDTDAGGSGSDGAVDQQPAGLAVDVPADLVVYGEAGGPFATNDAAFEVANDGAESVDWRAVADSDWILLAEDEGTLAPDEVAPLPVGVDASVAGTMADGQYQGTVVVREATAETPAATIVVHLVIGDAPGMLLVKEPQDFAAEGPEGGPFALSGTDYLISNQGSALLAWSVVPGADWMAASASSGELRPGERATITVVVDSSVAAELDEGAYTTTLEIRDETLGAVAAQVAATLAIQPSSGPNQ